jgi:hypothetical protein
MNEGNGKVREMVRRGWGVIIKQLKFPDRGSNF